jgi:hypothetical protein
VQSQLRNVPPIVDIQGDFDEADSARFERVVAPLEQAYVRLESAGGDLLAGLEIGEAIRRKKFITIVPNHSICTSSCALAWLGGVKRYMGVDAKTGFHAASDAAGRETGSGNALVGAYLTRLGLSYSAVLFATKASPHEMTWLGLTEAKAFGIDVELLNLPPISITRVDDDECRFERLISRHGSHC